MYLLGHIGLTLAAAEAWRRRVAPWIARIPLWALPVGAMLPDLIDKPLGHLILRWGTGRLWGHTLLFLVLLTLLALWLWPRAPRGAPLAAAMAFGVATHLLLDRIWEMPAVVLWPLLGPMPHGDFQPAQWITILFTDRYTQVGEVLGAAGLAWSLAAARRRARANAPRP